MRTAFRRPASPAPRALEPYDAAYLAGGPWQVAEAALVALGERGTVTVRATRVRAVEEAPRPDHPVECALTGLCPRSASVVYVLTAVSDGPEVAEIGRRLASQGLLTHRFRRRPTRAGRRRLVRARRDGTLPAYVLDGPSALPDGPLRRTLTGAGAGAGAGSAPPSVFRRRLVRMGTRAIDPDAVVPASGHHVDTGHGSFGGGGGGDC